ncbi:MAG: TonB-dependent receptor [Sphingobacteriales bacterium]|jgi:hypothetical protein|nr:TonB-dependent receptor [Sphingobacteriales bacterium]
MLKKIYLFIIVALLTTGYVNGQVTTSSITGKVINDEGSPLKGATVTATNTQTGAVYRGVTNENGIINLANMAVGGPYKVEVTYVGYNNSIQDDIFLQLGQPYILNTTLVTVGKFLEEVVVSGSINALKTNKLGSATTVTRTQIASLPSITRGVNDITRLAPQANGSSIGGGNYRSNNFMVDGANFNNQFGIGENVPARGAPISLDAIEQVTVNITPYDVRQSGFTGAAINAVTRSGKNKFFGTAFYTTRSDKQQGYRVENVMLPVNKFKENQFGASVGGPIIKNKLFFFLNFENQITQEPGPSKIASTPTQPFVAGSPNFIARPTAEKLDVISKYLKDNYNYETGPYQGYSNEKANKKLFGRIDWNINQSHKVNFRFSKVDSKVPSSVSTSTSNSGVTFSGANNRLSENALHFSNSNYFQEDNLYTGTLEYNGRIGNLNHSFRASYVNQYAPRSSNSSLFPLVDIKDGASVYTTFGYEPFTYGNLRDVKTWTANYDASYTLGDHNITGGLQFETSKTKNGFQRYGTGYFVFDSWDDFVNKKKPSNFAITYPLTPDGSQAFPSFKFNQFSLYLQDEYNVTDRFKLMAGLRLELPTFPGVDEIRTHPLVEALSFNGDEKINTGQLPSAKVMVSPRLGFNYDIIGDRSVILRGGSGVFTGRIPFVWIVAQSGDAGMLQYLQNIAKGDTRMPDFNPDPKQLIPNPKAEPGKSIPSSISAMAHNLKFPQTWKSSLAVDIRLPWGMVGTLEGIYNKDINSVVARDANLVNPQALSVSGYADNRMIYPSATIDKYINKLKTVTENGIVYDIAAFDGTKALTAIVMDNAKGGHYWSLTAQLTKIFSKGFSAMIAYTKSGAKNFGDGSGDQIVNLWSIPYQNTGNPNVSNLSFTSNVLPSRLVGSLSYSNTWIGKLKTSMNLFYSGSAQGRYSFYYTTDFNRDGQTNDLIYVPKDPSEITFVNIPAGTSGYSKAYTAQEQSDIFFNFIDNNNYLSTRKGQYAERNGAVMPWRNQWDFRLSQELFNGIGGGKNSFEVFWDVFNIGNLLNPDWGVNKIAQNGLLVPQNTSSLEVGGSVKPTFRLGASGGDIIKTTYRTNQAISSTYYMQFGVRLNFN